MNNHPPESLSRADAASPEGEPEATPDLAEFKVYTRQKQDVAEGLRSLLDFFRHRGDEDMAQQCHELLVKLAENRFTLAVLGQFKRGKSSLMNSIIGRELLPTGVLPLTSVVTILRFGAPEQLVVQRQNVPFSEKYPLSSLAGLVTERGNPSNQRELAAVYVELPVPLLRRGLEFVDTPGVGSAIEANTATTYAFLPSCDAAILVTSVDTPLTQTELEFLRHIRAVIPHLFLVVNKMDLVSPAEGEEVLSFIATVLQQEIDSAEVFLFPVSAQEGLRAKQVGDAAAYAHSGLKAFEEALSRFLSRERGAVLLLSILDKALRLVATAASQLELHRRSQETSPEQLKENLAAFQQRVKPLVGQVEAMTGPLGEELTTSARGLLFQELGPLLEAVSGDRVRELETTLRHMRWKTGRTVMQRCARLLEDPFHEAVTAWWQEQLDRVTPVWEQILRSREADLDEPWQAVLAVAAEIFQTPFAPDTVRQEFSVGLPARNLPGSTLPRPEPVRLRRGAVALLPAGLVQQPLRQWFRDCLTALQSAYQEAIAQTLEHRAGKIAEAFGGTLERSVQDFVATLRRPPAAQSKGRKPAPGSPAELAAALEQFHAMEQKLLSLREKVLEQCRRPAADAPGPAPLGATAPDQGLDGKEPPTLSIPAATEAKDADLSQSLQTRGCPLCDHLVKWTFDFFAHFQYQLVTDEKVRENFAQTGGFCPKHTWRLATLSNPRGLSLGHSSLTAHLAQELARINAAMSSGTPSVGPLVLDAAHCPLCAGAHQVAVAYADRMAAWLEYSANRDQYARSQGLCLAHLDLLLAHVRTPSVARFLLTEAARHFEEVTEDMLNFALKHDALRRHLESGDEKDAFYRALTHVVGDQRLMLP